MEWFSSGGLSLGWSFNRVVVHLGGLSLGWFSSWRSFFEVVFDWGGFHHGGLSLGWSFNSFIRALFHLEFYC